MPAGRPIFHGRGVFNYDFGLLPHRRPINIVIGEPIAPPAIELSALREIVSAATSASSAMPR